MYESSQHLSHVPLYCNCINFRFASSVHHCQGYLVLDFLSILAEKSRAGARSYSGES